MYNIDQHIINDHSTVRDALLIIDQQGLLANVLFVVNQSNALIGSVTDGDIRRGLLKGENLSSCITTVMQQDYKFLFENEFEQPDIDALCEQKIHFVPIINKDKKIVEVITVKQTVS